MTYHLAKFKLTADAVLTFTKTLLGLDRPQLYRPEAHYMRGPGPKWRALNGQPKRAVTRVHRGADGRRF